MYVLKSSFFRFFFVVFKLHHGGNFEMFEIMNKTYYGFFRGVLPSNLLIDFSLRIALFEAFNETMILTKLRIIAKVMPILKVKNTCVNANCLPVSTLNSCSKICEIQIQNY